MFRCLLRVTLSLISCEGEQPHLKIFIKWHSILAEKIRSYERQK